MQEIFHSGVLADFPISMVPLQSHDRLQQIEDVLCFHVAEDVGGSCKRVFLVVGSAHAATHVDIAAFQCS